MELANSGLFNIVLESIDDLPERKTLTDEDRCLVFDRRYLVENSVESHILWMGHFGAHAGRKLVHERQELVGWDLFHTFLKCQDRPMVTVTTVKEEYIQELSH